MTEEINEAEEMAKIMAQDNPEQASIQPAVKQKAKLPVPVIKNSPRTPYSVKSPFKKPIPPPSNSLAVKLDDFKAESLKSYGLNKFQIEMIYSQTPDKFVKSRKGRGGKNFEYVPVYITVKMLNLIFGLGWDFEITKEEIMWEQKQVLVKGKLTAHLPNGNKIIKEQYASKEIQYFKDKPTQVISIGDDLKGAASLCLTKCASYLGLFSDVYSSEFYAQYEMPDGIEEKEVDVANLFESSKKLISLVKDPIQKEQVKQNAITSGQFNQEQIEIIKKL